jgi:hypothetical protein
VFSLVGGSSAQPQQQSAFASAASTGFSFGGRRKLQQSISSVNDLLNLAYCAIAPATTSATSSTTCNLSRYRRTVCFEILFFVFLIPARPMLGNFKSYATKRKLNLSGCFCLLWLLTRRRRRAAFGASFGAPRALAAPSGVLESAISQFDC